MFSGLTPTAIITQATLWGAEVEDVILLVIGFAVFFILANWVIAKVRARR